PHAPATHWSRSAGRKPRTRRLASQAETEHSRKRSHRGARRGGEKIPIAVELRAPKRTPAERQK
ncbi:MAG: hypothetical protein ACXVCV_20545, partial [Polyangia bacterium]